MQLTQLSLDILTPQLADRILFEGLEYGGETADMIMVLGSHKACENRMPKAAELFGKGAAEKIILSGGKCQQTKYGIMPEYKAMSIESAALGLPADVLITEKKSLNTAENFIFTKEILSEKYPECRKIIVVTTAYHMKRACLLAKRHMPEYEIIPCPTDKGSTRRSTWQLTEKGRNTVCKEIMKLKLYAEKGYIDDTEI
jgi:uncharacterized SAM-binding protein YcdF (DUF218 family)